MSTQLLIDTLLRDNIFKMLVANTQMLNQLSEDLNHNSSKAMEIYTGAQSLRKDFVQTGPQVKESTMLVPANNMATSKKIKLQSNSSKFIEALMRKL